MDRISIVVIGGLIPAMAFGVAAIFQKGAALAGMGPASYVVIVGLLMVIIGLVLRPVLGESGWGGAPALWQAAGGGVLFGMASGAISLALQRYGAPISLIAPITVISTLVTVVLGLLLFREHEGVAVPRLLGGALLVVLGAALVSTS